MARTIFLIWPDIILIFYKRFILCMLTLGIIGKWTLIVPLYVIEEKNVAKVTRTLKPRLHMAHFKRARPGTELGSVPGPITRLFTLSGPGTAPTRSSTRPPSIFAMSCVCWSVFLDFDDVTELRWPVCCDYENSNLNLLDFAIFANSRRNLADQPSPRCVVILAFL